MYVNHDDVYRTAGITRTEVNPTDAAAHIHTAESFICKLTKTIYWKREADAQTATSGTNNTIVKSTASWPENHWVKHYVWIYNGTGSGQVREIISNTTNTLTVDRNWETNPGSGSLFRIIYVPSDFTPFIQTQYDGNNKRSLTLPKYPVRYLELLKVGTETITNSKVAVYQAEGILMLKSGAEAGSFLATDPLNVTVNYWYGVDDLPQTVKRLVELKAAIQILLQQMGGTFDDPSLVTLPEASISVGQAYINIAGTSERLQKEYDALILQVNIYPAIG